MYCKPRPTLLRSSRDPCIHSGNMRPHLGCPDKGHRLVSGATPVSEGDRPDVPADEKKTVMQKADAMRHQCLHLRGGSEQTQAFYDLDGTLYDGTMAHCAYWFCVALPSPIQRLSKAFQIIFFLPAIGIAAVYDEAVAAHILASITMRGVSEADAQIASKAVTKGVAGRAYPEVIEHLKTQQLQGKRTVILSGNIVPMIQDLAEQLSCEVVATEMELVGDRYTGKRLGKVCVKKAKRARMLEYLPDSAKSSGSKLRVVGVGNSMADVPFLELVEEPFVVRPSRRLRRLAERQGWDLSLGNVRAKKMSFSEHAEGKSREGFRRENPFRSLALSTILVWGAAVTGWLHRPGRQGHSFAT